MSDLMRRWGVSVSWRGRTLPLARLAMALLLSGGSLNAAVLTVGSGSALFPCDHAGLQEAIDAAVSGDEIRLGAIEFDGDGGFFVLSKDLLLRGGYAGCSPFDDTSNQTTLNSSAVASELFRVFGADVRFERLRMLGNGGRVLGVDTATVVLDGVEVRGGDTEYGAGVQVIDGEVELRGGTFVVDNDARDGAGIDCVASTVRLVAPIQIGSNTATGLGGGFYGSTCDLELAGLPGSNDEILFHQNDAGTGGALYLQGASTVQVAPGEQGHLVLTENSANSGGALYLGGGGPYSFVHVRATLNDAADSGGVLFAEDSTVTFAPGSGPAAGAAGNGRLFSSNSAGVEGASVFHAGLGATVTVEGGVFSDNGALVRGAAEPQSVVTVAGGDTSFRCESCAWDSNFTVLSGAETPAVIRVLEGATAELVSNTVVDNSGFEALFAAPTGSAGGSARAHHLLEQNNGLLAVFDGPLATTELPCGVLEPSTPIPSSGASGVIQTDAQLTGDYPYPLDPGSVAIDSCSVGSGSSLDIEGRSRPLGMAWEPGVWEYDPPLFGDDFEEGDTAAWSAVVP